MLSTYKDFVTAINRRDAAIVKLDVKIGIRELTCTCFEFKHVKLTVAFYIDGDRVFAGYAMQSPLDNYNKKRGNMIAAGRIITHLKVPKKVKYRSAINLLAVDNVKSLIKGEFIFIKQLYEQRNNVKTEKKSYHFTEFDWEDIWRQGRFFFEKLEKHLEVLKIN